MRIITWNVNGLRAILAKGSWEWMQAQSADVICLQEIKSKPEQLPETSKNFYGMYQAIWNPATRPGYSGVATFSRQPIQEYQLGFDNERFDTEGRVIQTKHQGVHLFNIYFPNGQRDQGRLDYKLDFYSHLLKLCDRLHSQGEEMILCGDFNTAHQEIDLRNPKSNQNTSGFMPVERAWIDQYLEHQFIDIFRVLYPQKEQYTWWTYISNARQRNVGWRLDYFLVSQSLAARVKDVVIHDEVMGSDHCPVSLWLDEPGV